ncbi:MAG: NAD(P)-dependent glycerol-3-phosphate dehydrogenase [Clostridia bacterium]|nr:NAD(P)-dependent glycerol-3-phosphate dehydrogenase [Clostridia bacterium]
MANVAVMGAGGWGTALATMCHKNGHKVTMWSPFGEEIAAIRRDGQHRRLLPDIPVSSAISLTTDVACVAEADLVLLTVPSFAIAETAVAMRPHLREGCLIANAGKGLCPQTGQRFSEILTAELPTARVTVLSGPSHAEEVARGVPTSVCIAAANVSDAKEVQALLANGRFRIYVTDDMVGVELGGALKNAIALAAGICDGLALGDNTKAALMTRGLAEMSRLGVALGAEATTFSGLSGMGDLIVTCGSMHSRNRRAGILIGQGLSAQDALERVGTVEGYFACAVAMQLAERVGVEIPIIEQCYRICYEQRPAREALSLLLGRPSNGAENFGN